MLQILGDKLKGLLTWIIVLVIAVVFIFFGLNDYFSSAGQGTAAKVGRHNISQQALESLVAQLSLQQGRQADAQQLKKQALNTLIRRTVLLERTNTLGLALSDRQLAEILLKIPAFQVDGHFAKEQYQKVLAEAGYSDLRFRKELQEDLCVAQLEQGLIRSDFATLAELQDLVGLTEEKRDLGYLLIAPDHYASVLPVSRAEEIAAYYDQHKETLISPVRISLQYVHLAFEDLLKKVKVSEAEIAAYYEQHRADYALPERVEARHLLIAAPKEDAAAAEKAQIKATELLDQIRRGGDFQALASRWSEDPGSATKGGALGWFARGQMVPEFEAAAFALRPGETSDLVQTAFGFHIIQLVAHKNPETQPLGAVQASIGEQLKSQKAQALFETQAKTLESLALKPEQNLEGLGKALSISVQTTPLFSAETAVGVAADPAVIQTAFDPAFLNKQSLSLVELSDHSKVCMRVATHQAAKQQSLEESTAQIRGALTALALQDRIKTFAIAFMKAVQAGQNPAALAKAEGLVWQHRPQVTRAMGMDKELIGAAFQLTPPEPKKGPRMGQFMLPDGRVMLLAVNKVTPGQWSSLKTEAQQEYRRTLSELSGQASYVSMIGQFLAATKIKLFGMPDVPS